MMVKPSTYNGLLERNRDNERFSLMSTPLSACFTAQSSERFLLFPEEHYCTIAHRVHATLHFLPKDDFTTESRGIHMGEIYWKPGKHEAV